MKRRSPAFRKGFTRGFCSPYDFLFGRSFRINPPSGDVTVRAWHDTGKDLEHAIEIEMNTVVQKHTQKDVGYGRRAKLTA